MDMMQLLFCVVITAIVLWAVIFFIALIATIDSEGKEETSGDIVEFTRAILTAIKILGVLTLLVMVFILIRSLVMI